MEWIMDHVKRKFLSEEQSKTEDTKQLEGDEVLEIIPSKIRQGYTSEAFTVRCQSGQYFVKVSPRDAYMKQLAIEYKMYEAENKCYSLLLPMMIELDNDFERFVPRYFGGSTDLDDQYLILEDLVSREYRVGELMETLSESKINLVLEAIGKFHALGILLHEKTNLVESIPELVMSLNPEDRGDVVKPYINYLEREGIAVPDKLRQLRSNYWQEWKRLRSKEEGDVVSVTHGDLWNNNLLFLMADGSDGEAVGLKLVDWQLTRLLPIGLEFSFFSYLCVDSDYLIKNFEKMLEKYMTTFYKTFDVTKSEKVPPSKDILRHNVEKKMLYGLLIAIQLLPVMLKIRTLDSSSAKNPDENDEDSKKSSTWEDDYPQENITAHHKQRLLGVLKVAQKFNAI